MPENDCDIGRFALGKTAGVQAAATGKFEQASDSLSAALAEWRGPGPRGPARLPVRRRIRHRAGRGQGARAHRARGSRDRLRTRYAIIGELESLTAEHPYREPLWAQLITAYYLAERQSDALDAYRRLKAHSPRIWASIPAPPLQALYERILRQEPLDVKRVARTTAIHTANSLDRRTAASAASSAARFATRPAHEYPLMAAATRIGRLPDNDIVLDDPTSAATTPSSSTPAPASWSRICGRPTESRCEANGSAPA